MLISDKNKFIFVHVPKTGGTSVTVALEPHCHNKCKDYKTRPTYLRSRGLSTHMQSRRIPKQIITKNYFIFGFVRNPWTWHVSYYEYIKRRREHNRHNIVKRQTFAQYIAAKKKAKFTQMFHWVSKCDFVGRTETLQEDFNHVMMELGLPLIELQQYKNSNIVDYAAYYDDTTRDLVAQLHRGDIERYGYEFPAIG